MVAFVTSSLIGLLGCLAAVLYGKRRPVGSPLSWGEAMAAATFAFFMFFWWYGVIPNTWLSWSDNDLGWGKDSFMLQHGQNVLGFIGGGFTWPVDIPKLVLRDMVVMAVYGVGIGLHLFMWAHWQNRSKEKAAIVPASRYGRPLVRKG